ncbi:MAG: T9SS type A sorting domain-containing protein, partial [Marinirhabdus sp.]
SMGGLVARYALAYMEQNGLEHETRLYISFDAPHKGANIPISLQYLINYLARSVNNDQAQAIVDEVLNSPAAKEMLYDHVLGHLLAGSDYEQDPTKLLPFGAPNFRDAFMAELATLNFPQDTRNVAVINGSGAGTTVGTPGTEVVNTTLNLAAGVTADAILHFTPAAAQNINVTSFETFVAGFPVGFFEAAAQALPTIDGVDAAPGGISFISNALGGAGGNQVIIDFINALNQDEFCFIPTMSALALQNEEDWYAIPDIGGVHTSPFDAVFIPTDNEPHTFVTKANAQFMLDEIDDPLAVEEHFTQNNYTLAQNPVNDKITININPKNPNPQATFTVHTYLGQQVIRTTALLQGKNQWVLDHSLSAGMYFLNIADADGNVTFKLLVK